MLKQLPSNILNKIFVLQNLDEDMLRREYENLFGCKSRSSAPVMRKLITYKLQADFYAGDLAPQMNAYERVANTIKDSVAKSNLGPGTLLTRLWKGRIYEARIREDGFFEYNGTIYKSLSGVATAITGTHWNGKQFFGVK